MSRFPDEHCSRWSGVPQGRLTDSNRLHIEILCRAMRTGVYNIRTNWEKAEFSARYSVFIVETDSLATYDMDRLTRLVVLAHDHCVRVDVGPKTFRHLTIMMHDRQRDSADLCTRHPTLEEAAAKIRSLL